MLTNKTTTLSSSSVIMDNPALEMRYRQTKIIFTIGPATSIDEVLKQLIDERVDICRINMAHATHEWTRGIIQQIKRICGEVGRHINLPGVRVGLPSLTEKDQGDIAIGLDEGIDFYALSLLRPTCWNR